MTAPRPGDRAPARNRVVALAVIVPFGLLLSLGGVRQFAAGLLSLPGNATLSALQERSSVAPSDLDAYIATEQRSLAILDRADGWSNLSLAYAVRSDSSDERHSLLVQARDAASRSLALAPANPYAWARLAVIEQQLGYDNAVVAGHWRQSVTTGPNEDRLFVARITLAIALWPDLTRDDHAEVWREIRDLWSMNQGTVLALARDDFSSNVIRAALAVDLQQFRIIDQMLKDRRRK
jgi:hypothetical protein